jgi:ribosomal protein S18 acetylase RimI-like enzyme
MNTTQMVAIPRLAAPRPRVGVTLRRTRETDAAALTRLLSGLSVQSRYLRFFGGLGHPSPRLVARLLCRDATHGAWLAEIGAIAVGHVMWALDAQTAELGVVVADAWQRRGIGRRLMQSARAEAAAAGATAVQLDVLVDNRPMVRLLRREMPAAHVTRDDGQLTFRAPITSATPVAAAS